MKHQSLVRLFRRCTIPKKLYVMGKRVVSHHLYTGMSGQPAASKVLRWYIINTFGNFLVKRHLRIIRPHLKIFLCASASEQLPLTAVIANTSTTPLQCVMKNVSLAQKKYGITFCEPPGPLGWPWHRPPQCQCQWSTSSPWCWPAILSLWKVLCRTAKIIYSISCNVKMSYFQPFCATKRFSYPPSSNSGQYC